MSLAENFIRSENIFESFYSRIKTQIGQSESKSHLRPRFEIFLRKNFSRENVKIILKGSKNFLCTLSCVL